VVAYAKCINEKLIYELQPTLTRASVN
jgi:hypothetical protein